MKNFKSITVKEDTFDDITTLSKILLPKAELSKAQVVEALVNKSLDENYKNNQEIHGNTEKIPTD